MRETDIKAFSCPQRCVQSVKNFESIFPSLKVSPSLSWTKCISPWGADFRKAYAELSKLRAFFPPISPFLALQLPYRRLHCWRSARHYLSTPRLHFSSISVTTAPISHLKFTNSIRKRLRRPTTLPHRSSQLFLLRHYQNHCFHKLSDFDPAWRRQISLLVATPASQASPLFTCTRYPARSKGRYETLPESENQDPCGHRSCGNGMRALLFNLPNSDHFAGRRHSRH